MTRFKNRSLPVKKKKKKKIHLGFIDEPTKETLIFTEASLLLVSKDSRECLHVNLSV